MPNRWDLIRVSLARRFFVSTLLQAILVLGVMATLCTIFGRQPPSEKLRLPSAFLCSSVFLAAGSIFLERARAFVKRERQSDFRRSLGFALGFATAFVAVQGYGLWAIDKGLPGPQQAQVGVHGFVVMLTAVHGMHFIVAQSVLLWVTLSAFADRYDHEYYWGVTFATWFWHALGIVWGGILLVFTMSFIA